MSARRRAVLAGLLLSAGPAAAQGEFPETVVAAGRPLRRQGVASVRYMLFPVYRAALYLERPSRDAQAILDEGGARLIRCRYQRGIAGEDVAKAWEGSFAALCGCAMPAAFHGWLRPIEAGAEEDMLFIGGTAELIGAGRPNARIDDPRAARALLAAWISPTAPNAEQRRGLLGADR